MDKLRVGILGATGIIGQRLISMIESHPFLEVTSVASSGHKSGMTYGSAVRWLLPEPLNRKYSEMKLIDAGRVAELAKECDMVVSALPSDAAGLERDFAQFLPVVSKSSYNRMRSDVPLYVPGVNEDHLDLIPHQQRVNGYKGFVSCDANCSSTQLAISLKPLMDLEPQSILVDTMQAVSGAGYPGIPSMDILGNVVPFIQDEEEKIMSETKKIMGALDRNNQSILPRSIDLAARCSRISVQDGHTETVFLRFRRGVDISEVRKALEGQRNLNVKERTYSFPEKLIVFHSAVDRPQPRIDAWVSRGMSVSVGGLRESGGWVTFTTVSHNTILGGAGGAICQIEALVKRGII